MSDQSLTREEAINLYGTEAATGWGRTEADANFKPVGSGGGDYGLSSFDPSSIPVSQPTYVASTINVDDYISAIVDTLPAAPDKYTEANPFYFDEQAANEVATAEFSPYYNELLQDYLGDVKLTADKNKGDATRILADLDKQKELFFQNNAQEFDKTIRGIKEGYSGKGLYFSGENTRTQEEAGLTNTNKLEGYLNTYNTNRGGTMATNEYQQTQARIMSEQKARDIAREKQTAILGGVNTQKDEAIDEYLYGMKTYYKNPDWKSVDPTKLSVANETGDTTQQQGVSY